jgi:hypothetical protein
MKSKYLIIVCLLSWGILLHAQGIKNNGASIVVKQGAEVVIAGSSGGFTNQAFGGTDGKVFLDGQISVRGNWLNNADGNVFADPDETGLVVFGNEPDKAVQELGGTGVTRFENLTVNSGTNAIILADVEIRVMYDFILHGTLDIQGDLYIEGSFTNNGEITGTGTVHYESITPQVVAPGSYPNLVLDNPGGLILTDEVYVETELILSLGSLVLGEHNLVLGPHCIITETKAPGTWVDATGTGMVVKEFSEAGSFNFPVGNFGDAPAYTPVDLIIATGIFNEGWVGVRLKAEKHPDNTRGPNALNRYWVIESGGITEFSYTAGFYYVDTDVNGDDALIDGVKSNDGAPPSTWRRMSRCVAGDNYFKAADQSSFSVFTGVEYYKPPVAVITAPADSITVYQTPFTIQGTASDEDNDISKVFYSLNGGEWLPADGITAWIKSVDIKRWKNVLEIKAEDLQNLESEIVKHNFILSIHPVEIPAGWSYISSYLEPKDPAVASMFANIVAANNLTILSGVNGLYAPAPFFINTLGNWDYTKGYKIKMVAQDELAVVGDTLTDKTLTFSAGTHIIPVLTDHAVQLADVIDNPQAKVNYMLDLSGNKVFWPAGGIFTLTELEPGKGYLTNFGQSTTIEYPDLTFSELKTKPFAAPLLGPWPIARTGNVHLISISAEAISQLGNVDYIGAFNSEGVCVGFAEISGAAENILLTVYGDDLYSQEVDGMISGEAITLKSYNVSENQYTALTPTWNPAFANSDGKYVADGLSAISALKLEGASGIGGDAHAAANITVYPNPAKDVLNINLSGLGSETPTGFQTLSGLEGTLLTTDGRPVKTFNLTGEKTTVNISGLQPGVYLLVVKSGSTMTTHRLVITP